MQKRFMYIAILLLAICNKIVAEDLITISDIIMYSGGTKEVNVVMTNTDSYVGFQFDMVLPEGITVESFSASERIPQGTSLQMAQQTDGSYRFIAYAQNRLPITGNDGAIMTLTIKASESVVSNSYSGYLRDVKISTVDGTGPTVVEQSFSITVKGAEPYAALSENNTVLTFYYDKKKEEHGGMSVGPFSGYVQRGWHSVRSSIAKVVFDDSFAMYSPTSTALWFWGLQTMTEIIGLENLHTDQVTDMNGMFHYCYALETLDLSNFNTAAVTNIAGMFYGCNKLKTITVGEGWTTDNIITTTISGTGGNGGWQVFSQCTSLVGGAGTKFDASHTDYTYAHIDGGPNNPGYLTEKLDYNDGDLFTAKTIEGVTLTFVVTNASEKKCFVASNDRNTYMDTSTTGVVTIPSIARGYTVEALSNGAFKGCASVTEFKLPETLVLIECDAFRNCTGLTTVHIPASVTGIENQPLPWPGCTGITSITVDPENPIFDSRDNCNAIFTTADSTLYVGCKVSTIPESTRSIGHSAFDSMGELPALVLPAGLRSITAYAFWACSFPSVTSYIEEPFETSCVWDHLPEECPLYVPKGKVDAYRALSEWNNFTTIVEIGSSITPEPYAVLSEDSLTVTFYYDDQKTSRGGMDINNSILDNSNSPYGTATSAVFDVSFDAYRPTSTACWFENCSSLATINGIEYLHTDDVTNMSWMFECCFNLEELDLSNFNTSNVTEMYGMFLSCQGLKSLNVSSFNTSKVVGMNQMFCGLSNLTNLDLSNFDTSNVRWMYAMFADCPNLTSLDISSFNSALVSNMGDLFSNCVKLKTIYVGDGWATTGVEENGDRVFDNCPSLVGGMGTTYDANHTDYTYAHIDGGPNNPGYFTDKNAPVVADEIIQFADANVKAICVNNWDTDGDGELSKAEAANVISLDNAFTGNKDITSFDEFQYFVGVIALGSREFGGCYNLSSIILPPNLKSLEAESLNGNKIDELTIPASVTSIEPSALYATYKNIFVEEGNAYFSSIDGVLFNKDITKIVTYPERKEAESYEIPNTVVTIGRCAFYSSELKSVTIPYGVNTIEGSAFRYCGNLESIDIPGSVETIGYDNFEFANSLTTATIPSSVKSIDTGVFASCQNLQEIIVDTNNQYYTSVDGVLYTKDKTHLVTYPAGKPDENVVIPNYVTSIGQCGVYGCNNIKSVVIPRRVESIGWFAFVNCANLNSVTTHRKKPLELTKTFDDRAQQNGTLYVPYGTKELYQAADEWNGFQNIVELDPSAIISLVNNGDMEGEDNGNFFVRTNYSSGNEEPVQAAISNGVGVNGSRGIKVEATSKLAVSWDNQFWVRLNQPISEGTLYRVSFDYRADKEAMIGAEAHEEPTAYINWGFFGNDLSFTDSWSHFEFEGTMSSLNSKDELPFQSLTFSFNNNFEDANNYYFDNFNFEVMMENQCPKPTFKQKGNEISILSPFNAKIYYTLDGSTPTTSSQVYAGSLKLTENAEINAIAVVEGYEASPVATCKFVHPQFDSNGVLAVTGRTRLSDALEAVGGREEVAKTITAILWEGNYAVYNRELQSLDNPNMLIYVNDESLAPQNRDNVIIGDFAKNIVLTDVSEGNGNFYCPRTFKAEMVSYTHEYRQQTEIGVSRGWETIALPFTVQTIMHEKNGLIAPFGNTASSKHFWLREMTPQGLGQATVISANMPYLISMPNNSVAYPAEFNLNGRVTFSSQDVDVVVTDIFPAYMQSEGGGMLMFAPCFKTLEPRQDAYALNIGEQRGHYLEGSVFESNYRAIRPFEAFTIHEGNSPAPQFIPVSDMNVGITDIGASLVNSEEANSEKWYDLNGRRLQQKPTQKGVYILNGKKTVVK